jgi:hypothetical protein
MKNFKITSSSIILSAFIVTTLLFLLPGETTRAQESTQTALPAGTWKGEVTGKVANQTPGGVVPNKLNLMLHGYGPDQQEVLMLDGTSSPDGSFRFKDVTFDPAVTYGVMTSYKEITYFSEPGKVKPGETKLDINLPLYETTADLSKVEAEQAHLLFSFDQGKLTVMQVYVISNKGDKTVSKAVTLPSGRTGTLKFSLPEEASNVEFPSQSSQRFIQIAGGFVDTNPLLPDSISSQVIVRYQMPYQEGMTFAYTAPFPVNMLTVLYPQDSGMQLASSALAEGGTRTSNDGKTFSVLSASGLESGKSVQIRISGEAVQDTTGGAVKAITRSNTSLQIVLGASILGLALVGVGVWGWRRNKQEDAEEDDGAGDADEVYESSESDNPVSSNVPDRFNEPDEADVQGS